MVEGFCLRKLAADDDGAVLGQIQRIIGCHQVVERLIGRGAIARTRAAEVDHIRVFHLRRPVRLRCRADILAEGDGVEICLHTSRALNDRLDILHIENLAVVGEVNRVDVLVKHHRDIRHIHAVFGNRTGLVKRHGVKALVVDGDFCIHNGV